MEIGCSGKIIMRFESMPTFEDIEVVFSQGSDEVLKLNKDSILIHTETDDDNNTVYIGEINLVPEQTNKFKRGNASVKLYGVTGENRIPSNRFNFEVTK